MKIKRYLLKNFQSWGEHSSEIALSPDTVNVFIAPSETGKSVVIKILKEMSFGFNWGYTPRGLIRRGCTQATAIFELANDNLIIFELTLKNRTYKLCSKQSDGTLSTKSWTFDHINKNIEIPEEIETEFGLLIDRKAKTILNVLDKDMPKPFSNASPELNARVLAAVTEDFETEKRRNNLLNLESQLKETEKIIKYLKTQAERRYSFAPSVDVSRLQLKITRQEQLLAICEPLELILELTEVDSMLVKPVEVKYIDLKAEILTLEALNAVQDIIDEVTALLSTPLDSVPEPSCILPTVISSLRTLEALQNNAEYIDTLTEPQEILSAPTEVPGIINILSGIDTVTDICKEGILFQQEFNKLSVIKEPPSITDIVFITKKIQQTTLSMTMFLGTEPLKPVTFPQEVKKIMGVLDSMTCLRAMTEVTSLIKERSRLKDTLNSTIDDLRVLEEELGVCPLCKQVLSKEWLNV